MDTIREQIREAGWENIVVSFFADMWFALRMVRKFPGFAAIAVLTLALGIGFITAIFSVVNAALIQSLRYEQPDRVVMIQHFRRARYSTVSSLFVLQYYPG